MVSGLSKTPGRVACKVLTTHLYLEDKVLMPVVGNVWIVFRPTYLFLQVSKKKRFLYVTPTARAKWPQVQLFYRASRPGPLFKGKIHFSSFGAQTRVPLSFRTSMDPTARLSSPKGTPTPPSTRPLRSK